LRLIGLKSCDTCKKALKELASEGWSVTYLDVRTDGIAADDMAQILKNFADRAINRASTTWRGLSAEEKTQAPEALLAAHPTLMKRPVIEHDGRWTIGWKADAKAVWLGDAG